jgi:DNA-binding NtrC family response regulator
VVILTGYGSVDMALKGFELGVYDYTSKPIHLGDLEAKIRQAFQRKILRE